jgi:hypothetical protein
LSFFFHISEETLQILSAVIGVFSRQKENRSMAGSKDKCVEVMEVNICESEPSTSKAGATQQAEVRKSHHNLPW